MLIKLHQSGTNNLNFKRLFGLKTYFQTKPAIGQLVGTARIRPLTSRRFFPSLNDNDTLPVGISFWRYNGFTSNSPFLASPTFSINWAGVILIIAVAILHLLQSKYDRLDSNQQSTRYEHAALPLCYGRVVCFNRISKFVCVIFLAFHLILFHQYYH